MGPQRVLVQGITGREGIARTRLMRAYGTQVVAGVTPGRGGATVEGVPVFDTVGAAWEQAGPLDASVLFIPAPLVKSAALEAIAAGVRLLVIVPDRVPIYDVLEIVDAADRAGARVVGPNTLGVLSPGRGVLGMMGGQAARARAWFFPGPAGVSSRSGGIRPASRTTWRAPGSALDAGPRRRRPIVGLPHPAVMRLFEQDPATRRLCCSVRSALAEEQVADLIASGALTKPVIAYIGGAARAAGRASATPGRSSKAARDV